MIIKLFNSETGDEQLLNVSDDNISNTIVSDITFRIREYEQKYGYGCTIDGLLRYLRFYNYRIGKIDYIPKIEFNH